MLPRQCGREQKGRHYIPPESRLDFGHALSGDAPIGRSPEADGLERPVGAGHPHVTSCPIQRITGQLDRSRCYELHDTSNAASGMISPGGGDDAKPPPRDARPGVNQVRPPLALEIRGLAKSFERPAVDRLDLSVIAGEFYTLLGPNGAGKTTTLRMVTGLLRPDSGSIAVFGIDALSDPIGARRIMAWVSDEPMIYEKLTPLEYLDFVSGLWAVDGTVAAARARDLLGLLGLTQNAEERCERLSKGMRQKVALAGALIHEPKLIILDEPFTGLDAGSSRVVKEVLRQRVQQGCSVIMTTHILEVAERMADRIGVMANGTLIADGTLDELRRQVSAAHSGREAVMANPDRIGTGQIGTGQIGTGQIGTGQIGTGQIGTGPIGTGLIGTGLHDLADGGSGHASLEDTFLALVAQDATAA
jgi:ABC-2 type transport system ATP-binding protein